jgi:hypothetical protein
MSLEERPEVTPPAATPRLRPKQRAFLTAYRVCGNVRLAAELAGCSRVVHYLWLQREPHYRAAFEWAVEDFADRLRQSALERAVDGVPEPIVWAGKFMRDEETQELLTTQRRSDRLLEIMLKAHCPEFREKTELTGPAGGPVVFQVITGVPQPDGAPDGAEDA